jgi:dihydroorotase
MSTAPARIGRLPGQGQPLEAGSVANLTLVDPDRTVVVDAATSRSRSRNNPWHGRALRGGVHTTIHRGRVTYSTEPNPADRPDASEHQQ